MRVAIIDYGSGNLRSATKAFERAAREAGIAAEIELTDKAGFSIHYTLDNAGNRIQEDTKSSGGTLYRTLNRIYNTLGQLQTLADASSNPTDFTWDANGNPATLTDALSHQDQADYDPLDRLQRTLQDVGGIAAQTTFAYDALDNLTKGASGGAIQAANVALGLPEGAGLPVAGLYP